MDWWSLGEVAFSLFPDSVPNRIFGLGVVTYELSTGRRPYEIHSQTPNKETRLLFLTNLEWPPTWPPDFTLLVSKVRPKPKSTIFI